MRKRYRSKRSMVVSILAGALVLSGCSSSSTPVTKTVPQLLKEGVTFEAAGNLAGARADFEKIIADSTALSNGYGAVAYYNLGVLDQRAGNVSSAMLQYNRALALAPQYEPAIFNLAIIDSSTNFTMAIALYKRILLLQPTNADAMYNLGLVYYFHSNVALGRVLLHKAIKITPSLVTKLPSTVTF